MFYKQASPQQKFRQLSPKRSSPLSVSDNILAKEGRYTNISKIQPSRERVIQPEILRANKTYEQNNANNTTSKAYNFDQLTRQQPRYFSPQAEDILKQNIKILQENKMLQEKVHILKQKNRALQKIFSQFINEIKSSFTNQGQGQIKNKNIKKFENLLQKQQTTNHVLLQSQKICFTDESFNPTPNCCRSLRQLNASLQQQNSFLIKYKNQCLHKISVLKQQINLLKISVGKQHQNSILKSQKISQNYSIYLQDRQTISKLQKLLQQTNDQLLALLKSSKAKQQQNQLIHQKFHKQMQKMKQKVQVYKQKMDRYRQQRNQLQIQVRNSKINIQNFEHKKFFPEDSDD